MSDKFEKLDWLLNKLMLAAKEQNWVVVAQLDQQVRKEITALGPLFYNESSFEQRIEEIRHIYQNLISETTLIRDQLGKDLRKLSNDNRAINQYLGINQD